MVIRNTGATIPRLRIRLCSSGGAAGRSLDASNECRVPTTSHARLPATQSLLTDAGRTASAGLPTSCFHANGAFAGLCTRAVVRAGADANAAKPGATTDVTSLVVALCHPLRKSGDGAISAACAVLAQAQPPRRVLLRLSWHPAASSARCRHRHTRLDRAHASCQARATASWHVRVSSAIATTLSAAIPLGAVVPEHAATATPSSSIAKSATAVKSAAHWIRRGIVQCC